MKSIGGFFDKFTNKIVHQVYALDMVVESIKKHTGITVDLKDIVIKNGVLRIRGTSLMKNEIYIKKPRILKELEGKLKTLNVVDIQ